MNGTVLVMFYLPINKCAVIVHSLLPYIVILCGAPPNGTNTQAVPQVSLLYQDTYNYSCLTGYETNDVITTECLSNGSLSLDSPPTCTSK